MKENEGASAFATQHATTRLDNGTLVARRVGAPCVYFAGDSAKSLVYSHVAWDKCVLASAFVSGDYIPFILTTFGYRRSSRKTRYPGKRKENSFGAYLYIRINEQIVFYRTTQFGMRQL